MPGTYTRRFPPLDLSLLLVGFVVFIIVVYHLVLLITGIYFTMAEKQKAKAAQPETLDGVEEPHERPDEGGESDGRWEKLRFELDRKAEREGRDIPFGRSDSIMDRTFRRKCLVSQEVIMEKELRGPSSLQIVEQGRQRGALFSAGLSSMGIRPLSAASTGSGSHQSTNVRNRRPGSPYPTSARSSDGGHADDERHSASSNPGSSSEDQASDGYDVSFEELEHNSEWLIDQLAGRSEGSESGRSSSAASIGNLPAAPNGGNMLRSAPNDESLAVSSHGRIDRMRRFMRV